MRGSKSACSGWAVTDKTAYFSRVFRGSTAERTQYSLRDFCLTPSFVQSPLLLHSFLEPDAPHLLTVTSLPYRILKVFGDTSRNGDLKYIVLLREPAMRTVSSWRYRFSGGCEKGLLRAPTVLLEAHIVNYRVRFIVALAISTPYGIFFMRITHVPTCVV